MKVTLEKDDIIDCVEKALRIEVDRDKIEVRARPRFEVVIHDARKLTQLPSEGSLSSPAVTPVVAVESTEKQEGVKPLKQIGPDTYQEDDPEAEMEAILTWNRNVLNKDKQ